MVYQTTACFAFLCSLLQLSDSAKILGVFIMPCISHQSVFQPIWRKLSLRGHEVTVLTPNPLNDPTLTNLTEIDLSSAYEVLKIYQLQSVMDKNLWTTTSFKQGNKMLEAVTEAELALPQVQELINDQSKHFDVILAEFLYPAIYAFSARFKCPLVGLTSFGALVVGHDAIGNPSHPVLAPDFLLPFFKDLTLFDRIYSTFYSIWYRYYHHYDVLPKADKMARKYIYQDMPYLGDIEKNVSMLFLNLNFLTQFPRPNTPALIEMGSMHIKNKEPLPKDLQKELDDAKEGAVYFSLGSIVRSELLPLQFRNKIYETISELPYKVFWKWEDDDLIKLPTNVIMRKWFPQQNLLRHPNIKVFLTQGGLQSVEEAIHYKVPLVAMPFLADQPFNVRRIVDLGIARSVDPNNFSKQELEEALIEVAENPKYKKAIKKISILINDVPMTGLEKAVWWIEYVIRHKGAHYLRSPSLDLPWYQYFLLDVLCFILATTLIFVYILYFILSLIVNLTKNILFASKQKTL